MSSADTVVKGLDKLAGTRKVKQIATMIVGDAVYMHALCWDGTIWELRGGTGQKWTKIIDIPAPA